jgi:glycosyltransferase involved in cell wall biosynthesis
MAVQGAKYRRATLLVVGPLPPPYHGVSAATANLLNSSLRDFFHVVHLDIADRRSLANVANLDLGNIWLAIRHGVQFSYLLVAKRPQLVYIPISEGALGFLRDSLFLVPARLARRAVVIHLHAGAFDRFYRNANAALRWLIRFCLKKVNRAVVLGDALRSLFSGIISQDRVRVVPNGVPGEPHMEYPVAAALEQRKFRVLFMGNLWQSKGFMDFIHAAPLVQETVADVEFLLMGDDSFAGAENAKQWVRDHSLANTVRFLGVREGEEKTNILKQSDVLVFPSRGSEGQPLVLLEAMAAGVPIVATRHATAEQTLGNEGALFIRPQDPADLAQKVITLLRDPNLRRSIATRNRVRWKTSFTLEKFAANLETVLFEALAEHSHNGAVGASRTWVDLQ